MFGESPSPSSLTILDRSNSRRETGHKMLDIVQLDEAAFRLDILGAVRLSALRDECNAVVILPTLAELPNDENFNQICSVSGFAGYGQAQTSIHWSYPFGNIFAYSEGGDFQAELSCVEPSWDAKYSVHLGQFSLVQIQPSDSVSIEYFQQGKYSDLLLPTPEWVLPPSGELIACEVMRPKPRLDFFCEAAASKLEVFAAYIKESAHHARELLKRIYRSFVVLSIAACKCGYLSQRAETAARDHVIHLEMIALAKEHEEGPSSSYVGQILTFGEESWTRIKRSFSNLFSDCSEKVQCFGSIGVGLRAEAL